MLMQADAVQAAEAIAAIRSQAEPWAGGSHGGRAAERVALTHVQGVLGLEPIRHAELLGQDTWFIGGAVRRWLCDEFTGLDEEARSFDVDVCFASHAAFLARVTEMLREGYSLHSWAYGAGYAGRRCVTPAQCVAGGEAITLFHEEIQHLPELRVVNTVSPDGFRVDPHPWVVGNDPSDVFRVLDFSVRHFGMDNQYLYVGKHAWQDLARKRARIECFHFGVRRHYQRLLEAGYRPTLRTRAAVGLVAPVLMPLKRLTWKPPRRGA